MTQAQAIAKIVQLLLYDLNHEDAESPTEAQHLPHLNYAIRFIAQRVRMRDVSVTFTLTANQAEYNLLDDTVVGKKVIYVHRVVIGTKTLRKPNGEPGTWTLAEFQEKYPDWRNTDAGTVSWAAKSDDTLILHPKPDATDAAKTCYIDADILPDDVTTSDDSNELPIPVYLHEAACWIAAHEAGQAFASEEGWKRIENYYAMALAQIAAAETRHANEAFGDIHSREWPDVVMW